MRHAGQAAAPREIGQEAEAIDIGRRAGPRDGSRGCGGGTGEKLVAEDQAVECVVAQLAVRLVQRARRVAPGAQRCVEPPGIAGAEQRAFVAVGAGEIGHSGKPAGGEGVGDLFGQDMAVEDGAGLVVAHDPVGTDRA